MKKPTYIIAGLLILLWGGLTLGFHSSWYIDILLLVAVLIILLRLFYSDKTTN